MRRGRSFVVQGLHSRTKSGIVGLYERFTKYSAMLGKSSIGLVFLKGELVASFTYGEESDNKALLKLAEISKEKYLDHYTDESRVSYNEKHVRGNTRLMVISYQILTDKNNSVYVLDRLKSTAERRSRGGMTRTDRMAEHDNPLSEQYISRCVWCGARRGQLHATICRGEICPRCKKSLLHCSCTRMPEDIQPDKGWDLIKDSWWPSDEIRIAY